MSKTAPALLAVLLLAGSQIGCRSCGGSHLDYASPVAGCACSSCDTGCRAGSVFGSDAAPTVIEHAHHGGGHYETVEGEVIVDEAANPIPAPPQP